MNVIQGAAADNKDDDVPLPGFRFHPTDEELVGFYLRRKVDKKPLRIELIKQIDIYKFDPWDLPKPSTLGENESYFFCKRGRKYRNSIRPNRVTGSGFWKATGIDKPVYSHGDGGSARLACIGLKKTLVYYRGSAGKGTKTDWMMHEFRLPSHDSKANTGLSDPKSLALEAEVWTICRIFKRNVSHRKYTPDWRELAAKRPTTATVPTSQIGSTVGSNIHENYIAFGSTVVQNHDEKPIVNGISGRNQCHADQWSSSIAQQQPSSMASSSSFSNCPENNNDFFTHANWDELKSVVEFALDPFPL